MFRWIAILLLVVGCFLTTAFAGSLDGQGAVAYSDISDLQKQTFRSYISQKLGTPVCSALEDCEIYWDQLEPGQAIAFAEITHALEHTALRGGNGLQEIEQVLAVEGDQVTESGDPGGEPFQIRLLWKKDASKKFMEKGFFFRFGTSHVGEWGLGFLGSPVGLHLLFYSNSEQHEGHLHIDYRWPGEGHFTNADNDVRAVGPQKTIFGHPIDNYVRHKKWWGDIPGFSR
jgi:hypothetical protein